MTERPRPIEFREAIEVARVITDRRTEFEVYLDAARRLVQIRIGKKLAELPVSETHRKELIEVEAYALAQPAHLSDASTYEPAQILSILDDLGVFGPRDESDQ